MLGVVDKNSWIRIRHKELDALNFLFSFFVKQRRDHLKNSTEKFPLHSSLWI